MNEATGKKLLLIEDVSTETGFPVETLRYWRKEGRGPRFVRIGRRLVCRAADLDAWLEAQFADAT